MKKSVKIIIGIILAVAVAGGIVTSQMAPLVVETTTLESETAKVTFTEQGSYIYDRSMAVMPQIAGEVLEVKAKEGAAVKKGDVLAVISASDYEHQIKSLESSIAGYKAQIDNLYVAEKENKNTLQSSRQTLMGQLNEIEISIKDAATTEKSLAKQLEIQEDIMNENRNVVNLLRKEYDQAKDDFDDGLIDQPQLNAVRQAYAQAHAQYDMSLQQYEQIKNGKTSEDIYSSQRESLKNQLALVDKRLGQDNAYAMQQYYNAMIEGTRRNIESMTEKLGQANVVAPMDGTVTALPVENSNVITPATNVATISAAPVIEVYVPIREIDGIKVGDTAELVLSKRLGDETLTGKITKIESEAEMKISALGVEERKVRVLLAPDGSSLSIGYSMDIKFTVFEQPNSIIIPKTALFEKDGKDNVWVNENGAVNLRIVTKGIETREGYAIIAGLKAGDIVVSDANVEGLKVGKKIKSAVV